MSSCQLILSTDQINHHRIVTGTVVKSVHITLGPHDNSNPPSVSKGHGYGEVHITGPKNSVITRLWPIFIKGKGKTRFLSVETTSFPGFLTHWTKQEDFLDAGHHWFIHKHTHTIADKNRHGCFTKIQVIKNRSSELRYVQVSKWTVLVTDYGSALLGPWTALTDLTVVGIGEETEGAVQAAASLEACAQFLPCEDTQKHVSSWDEQGRTRQSFSASPN